MRILLASVALLLSFYGSYGQSLKKYAIGNSGCSAYFLCDPGTFDAVKSDDSSDIYTGECSNGGITYGIICVKVKTRMTDLDKSEGVLIAYLDYLKKTVNIIKAAGYGKGHRLKNNEQTRGVIDYWEDNNKAGWKVTGWTDGRYVVCMYAYSLQPLNEAKVGSFMNGLVLPAM